MTVFETSASASQAVLPALWSDLGGELPQAVRLQRLVDLLRAQFGCGAVALLRLEDEHLRPVAVNGLVGDALGRRFAVAQHPRLAAILARREVTCFEHDSQLPDPYDGLLDTLVGEPLPVHDCMGVALHVEGRPWGALTFDALATGTFGPAARQRLAQCVPLAEAVVRVARLEQELRALRMAATAPGGLGGDDAAHAAAQRDPGELEIVGKAPRCSACCTSWAWSPRPSCPCCCWAKPAWARSCSPACCTTTRPGARGRWCT